MGTSASFCSQTFGGMASVMAARTRCGSGLQAVLYAAGQVATGAASVAVAGGAESMSNVEHYAVACEPACTKGPLRCTTGWTAPARPRAVQTIRRTEA